MKPRTFLITASIAVFFIVSVPLAIAGETYYIDYSPLHLYKTINWWYDSTPEESNTLCGKPIKCKNVGNTEIRYDEMNEKIELKIKGGLASMLLAFKNCEQCYGPSNLNCTWLNQNYIKSETVAIQLNEASIIDGFTFTNVKKEDAQLIKNMAKDMQFVVEGVIGGLSSSRIALHESADLLKYCNAEIPDQKQYKQYPISLKIVNANTNEILAIFSMTWDR